MAELQRASVFAIKEEVTTGTLIAPAGASEFVPLKSGFSITSANEVLTSDELLNDIGASKGQLGIENPTGSHGAYLKHSEVEGQAPEWALLLKSALGSETVNGTEYSTTSGSTAGTATARAELAMASDNEDNFVVGQGLLIKDSTNGYSIRNVYNVDSAGNALDLNFNLDNAPGTVALGKAVSYIPTATGHPSFSAWMYSANGGAIQAAAGCKVTDVSINLPTGQQAEIDFNYAGTEFFFNPITITASSSYIDFTDDSGTVAAQLEAKIYKSPEALRSEIETKMNAVATDTITVTFNSHGADKGKFVIASDGSTTFSLLWNTGTNTANSAKTVLGYDNTDDTGAFSYTSDSEQSYAAPYTPTYDNANNIVCKDAEIMIGSFSDNICRPATNISFSIGTPTVDVLSLCAKSGLSERLTNARTVEMTANLILQKHEAGLFDKFINNTTTSAMVNIGSKDSSGNWEAGKCVNMYMANATITQHETSGDDFISLDVTCTGFVDSDRKDIYINFL